ncbi:MAG: hypothetical protein H7308_14280 [Chthonomonadaceae bacterium]|nr:hypothetical protein [Chthonomonadaceae bacterium]
MKKQPDMNWLVSAIKKREKQLVTNLVDPTDRSFLDDGYRRRIIEKGEPMTGEVRKAFERVERAFAHYPKPSRISHCTLCYTEEKIANFLAIPTDQLRGNDFDRILYDLLTCWGDREEVAYYVPTLLKFFEREELVDEERLYERLLPHLNSRLGLSFSRYDEWLSDEERKSVFLFVAAVAEEKLSKAKEYDFSGDISEVMAFLSAFDAPIAPLLERLANSPVSSVRAHFAFFIAKHVEAPSTLVNLYMMSFIRIPENEETLRAYFSGCFVADYLLANTEAVDQMGEEAQRDRDTAFDWAMLLCDQKESVIVED